MDADGTVVCGADGANFEGVRTFGESRAEHECPREMETGTPACEGFTLFPCATVGPELDGCGVGACGEEDSGAGSGERD